MPEGIRTIEIATPWPVGPVRVYLIEDDPLTLIDAGQRSDEALAELEAGLAEAGHTVEDLERIVITHQHIDHSGAAASLAERSGAELCALDSLATWMERYPASLDDEDEFATSILRAHGVIARDAERGSHRGGHDYGAPAAEVRRLRAGDALEFAARRLQVLFRPGHSPYDTVLYDEEAGVLFGGDHVLHWPSTPILAPPVDGEARNGRPRAFAQYLASLRATAALEIDTILPGHGEPVLDHRATIAAPVRALRADHRADRGGRSPRAAHGGRDRHRARRATCRPAHAFFVLCEVLGHLDQLIDEGAVVEHRNGDGVSRFARA